MKMQAFNNLLNDFIPPVLVHYHKYSFVRMEKEEVVKVPVSCLQKVAISVKDGIGTIYRF